MDKRQALSNLYGRKYFDRFTIINGRRIAVCYYCNEPATEHDHVPPIAYIGKEILLGNYEIINQIELLLIPACRECNRRLSAKPLLTPEERREYIEKSFPLRVKQFKKRDIPVIIERNESKEIMANITITLTHTQVARIMRKLSRFYGWKEFTTLTLGDILVKAISEYAEERTGTFTRHTVELNKFIAETLQEGINNAKTSRP